MRARLDAAREGELDRDACLTLVTTFYRRIGEHLKRIAGDTFVQPAWPADVRKVVATLSPRLRDVLERLLAGDGEKQIAAALGLSRHTVHDYVRQIYVAFGVGSRGELLARFVVQPRRDD